MSGVGAQSVLGFRALLNAKGAAGSPPGISSHSLHSGLGYDGVQQN